MKRLRIWSLNLVVVALSLVAGCQSPSKGTGTPQTTPSQVTQMTGTLTPVSTPEAPVEILENILFETPDPDCQLPCWQGLTVGVSKSNDIQYMFDTTLGFNGSIDFFGEVHTITEPFRA